ncbi:MAG TPA: hypothetical protein VK920_12330 [Solirubrobacterales bacterium]|nr:hypothetical protein [Solirubrobacterales bacterium]
MAERHRRLRLAASAVIAAMEQAKGSRKAERLVERMVRQRLRGAGA